MVKVISLSNEAYEKLKSIKGEKSFSEVVIDLSVSRPNKNIAEFCGVLKNSADEWESIKNKLYEDRKKFRLKEVKI